MTMTNRLTSLSLAALLFAVPAVAQETATEQTEGEAAPATQEAEGADLDLDMGTPADAESDLGRSYIKEVSGDWEIHCIRTNLDADPCALHQLLRDGSDNSVATLEVVNLPAGQQAAAGATIVTPLETLLTEQITLSVDGSQGRKYPFSFCTPRGCVSRVGFTQASVDAFKRGNAATLTIVPVAAPDQEVVLGVSLAGFTAGFEQLQVLNAANAEAIKKATEEQNAGGN